MDDRRARLQRAHLYLVSSGRPGGRALAEVLGPALACGVDVFQLRDKDAADDELLAAGAEARALCHEHGALFIVNDRPDLAVACGADGVHLGQDDMAIEEARAIVGRELLIGRSTHSPPQIDAVRDADYIGVGPVYSTPTKRWRPATGVGLLEYARQAATVPWFAIGGIDAINLERVVAAGAARVAVVRAIAEAPEPGAAAARLRAALPVEGRVG